MRKPLNQLFHVDFFRFQRAIQLFKFNTGIFELIDIDFNIISSNYVIHFTRDDFSPLHGNT